MAHQQLDIKDSQCEYFLFAAFAERSERKWCRPSLLMPTEMLRLSYFATTIYTSLQWPDTLL